jgi:redox-sensitive bicupin YhaK (pirin superfamily)
MSIKIYPFEKQVPGGFNNGAILENRPIVLTEDKKGLQPYSNIFYWAHAWSDEGSTIGEHPHKVFEIMSFILKGSIEHYDSKNRKWMPLKAGDAQIIRAGSGISHAEKINANSAIFQIWLDPDITKTIKMPAEYDDYSSDKFPETSVNGLKIKTYADDNAPMKMETPGIRIMEISFSHGAHRINTTQGKIISAYLVEGKINISGSEINANDFFTARDEVEIVFKSDSEGKLFVIESPAKVDYKTYAERYK